MTTPLYTPLPLPNDDVPPPLRPRDSLLGQRYVVMFSINGEEPRTQLHPVVFRERPTQAALLKLLEAWCELKTDDDLVDAVVAMYDEDTLQIDFWGEVAEARILIVEVE